MSIHPFSAALRPWGTRRSLATDWFPVRSWSCCAPGRRTRRGECRGAPSTATLYSQALAALRATCVDHLAAAGRLHTDAKAMGTLAAGEGRVVSGVYVGFTWGKKDRRPYANDKKTAHPPVGGEIGFFWSRHFKPFSFYRLYGIGACGGV